ncbi:MAG: alpha/beta hydrolase family protein [Candidatus Polarisedimenticolia bacterium]
MISPEDARRRLIDRLGRIPAPVPPSPPAVDRRFTLEGIAFERWRLRGPREEIPAWFLMAEDAARPAPALLALHPHGRQFELGKSLVAGLAGEASRAYGAAAAREGFGVLIPDLPAFEDRRRPLAERKRNYALQGEAYERLLAMEALVHGATLQGWILADLCACADILALDRRVDVSRLSVIGQSFGGQEAIFAMLYDPRFRAGIVSCGFSLVKLLFDRSLSHNPALYLPGMIPDLDFDTIVPALAPRPLTVIAGREDDIFPLEGVEAVAAKARRAWALAGAADRFRLRVFEGRHDLPADELREALRWLRAAVS